MRRRSRVRRVLKWVGAVACALVATTFVAGVRYVPGFAANTWDVCILEGCLRIDWNIPPYASLVQGFYIAEKQYMAYEPQMEWWPYVGGAGSRLVAVPLWMIFAALLGPTAFLWHRDRRIPPGHCDTCGYDLTGNVSGRCPECGTPVTGKTAR